LLKKNIIPCHSKTWDSFQPNNVHAIEPLRHLFYRHLEESRSSIRKLSSTMHHWKTFHPQRHDRPPPRRHNHFEVFRLDVLAKLHPLATMRCRNRYHGSIVYCQNTFDSCPMRSIITETSQSCRYLSSSCALIDTPLGIIVFASRQTRNNVHLTHSPIDLHLPPSTFHLPPSTNFSTKSASPV
jgi:hypothetical protein